MIEFSCVYCGEPVRANEEQAGETMECPACGHSIIVRRKEPGEALKPAPSDDADARRETEDWQGKSDQEVFDRLLFKTLAAGEKRRLAARRRRWLPIPRCDDVTLFALSFGFWLLWSINPGPEADFREAFSLLGPSHLVTWVPILALIVAIVSLLSLLLRRSKSDREEFMTVLFVVTVAAGAGTYAGYTAMQEHLGWLIVFPVGSILGSVLLPVLLVLGLVDSEPISRWSGLVQAMLAAAAVAALLMICQYRFRLHWAITFSIVICYLMSLHNTIRSIFGPRPPGSFVLGAP